MENITASELAGLGVGTLLFCATIAAPKIDALISSSQRSSLGMCKKCGDLKMIACSRCKGKGLVKGGPFNFSLVDETLESLGVRQAQTASIPCTRCQAKGQFHCPDCCKLS